MTGSFIEAMNSPFLDLTPLWMASHAHLRPLTDALPLPRAQQHGCACCGSARAITLIAHVRFGESAWYEAAQVDYCPDCAHFFLPVERAARYRTTLGVDPEVSPTVVDARLWSRTPTFLNIEPTTRCNYSCWYCVGRHMKQEDINVADFARMLDNFPALKTIALVGEGEPLMHKGFFEMARMAVGRGIHVGTLSNGSTLSSSNVRKICESGITYLSVSIDSFDPATFASSRIGGDLQQVLNGVRRLRDYRDENGYRYPKIALKGTLFRNTRDQLPRIAGLAKEYGFEIFESFQVLNPMRTYVPIYPRDKLAELKHNDTVATAIARDMPRMHEVLQSVQSFFDDEGIDIDKNGTPNGLRPGCDEQWIYSLLSGDVTPCCQIKTPIDPAWNLFRSSIDEILANHRYENLRFNLWNGLFPRYCRGCYKIGQAGAQDADK
jgi:MoaA/NifB/PqqE/SkfB family radical SAM enzyme